MEEYFLRSRTSTSISALCSPLKISIISSNQQRNLLKKYVELNLINYELELNKFKDDPNFISKFLVKFDSVCKKKTIDYLFVQGDTNTAYATSLYGFLKKIPIIHLVKLEKTKK